MWNCQEAAPLERTINLLMKITRAVRTTSQKKHHKTALVKIFNAHTVRPLVGFTKRGTVS